MNAAARISYEELPSPLQEQLRSRVERLGYLGEFFQIAASQPEALSHFIGFTEALKDALDWRLVEVIALTIAVETDNEYERVQHERLALALGMSREEVRALVAGAATAEGGFTAAELAAVRVAREVVYRRGRGCPSAYAALEQRVGHEVAVGCLMTAARYLAHSTMANTWGLRAPVASPLAELEGAVDG